jgi:hypothetical protein
LLCGTDFRTSDLELLKSNDNSHKAVAKLKDGGFKPPNRCNSGSVSDAFGTFVIGELVKVIRRRKTPGKDHEIWLFKQCLILVKPFSLFNDVGTDLEVSEQKR